MPPRNHPALPGWLGAWDQANLDILAEPPGKGHQPFQRNVIEPATGDRGNPGLVNAKFPCRRCLGQAPLPDGAGDDDGEFCLGQEQIRIGQAEIGKDMAELGVSVTSASSLM